MAVRRKLIRQQVEMLLSRHNVAHGPVPVDAIARALGIQIKLDKVDDTLSGFLVRDRKSNGAVIGANKSHHPHRQRFTIAHELGHFLLHEGQDVHLDENQGAFRVNLRSPESAKGEDTDEKEANLFAAELLMPAVFLEQDLHNSDFDLLGDGDVLEKLAKKYKVSVQALTFRLAYLGYISL
ncbi:ImmA/IrrE family metallo-endopeptidase [Bradyrhizobium glycinis]|uniref:ImmA/IrrE family metallo-endopeptidase n=1 Tax=Bradyrhizobium glycinis TaxID=2751812 RepID=UPI0018DA2477|nr:ImmA/IrrE family metallo-endopeptidase [Bradyrhizobium glycinis]MBH5373388.1 ImmA/IrrE family metallo-endopeptidase [Bradyrhizobium glycinis]